MESHAICGDPPTDVYAAAYVAAWLGAILYLDTDHSGPELELQGPS